MKNFTFILFMALTLSILSSTRAENLATAAGPDKWALWQDGPHLRGANIHQRRSYLDADGPDIAAIGPVIPPYTQADFDKLAAMGANYVNISHPGLFSEEPPYSVDTDIQNNLDQLLAMIAQANMFAVIAFRTGPGRNEFTFLEEESPGWLGYSKDINFVWTDQAAQDAWVEMWRYTAERYKDNPVVVGYDLMVEPNSNALLNIWDPDNFYAAYANSLYDWNQFYPDISAAIRQVDTQTPILIGGMSYSAVGWLPYLQPTGDSRTAYTAHDYEPFVYTHQYSPLTRTYPGVFDADYDNVADTVNKSWLDNYLAPIDTFKATHKVPVVVNEYGVMRWQPGADQYMADMMALLEQRGLSHAWWLWPPSDSRFADYVNDFNVLFGPNPNNKQEVATSSLLQVIEQNWSMNVFRPDGTNAAAGSAAIPDPIADRVLGQQVFNNNASGSGNSGLSNPAGVAIAPDGRLFVVDYGNNRVLSWPSAASFSNGQAADLVLGQPDFDTTFAGSALNKMDGPESVLVDSAGRVYVADSGNHRVLIFIPDLTTGMLANIAFGSYQAAIPDPPLQNLFNFPRGPAMDNQNNLYLVDEFHGRVLVYLSPITTDTTPDFQFLNLNDPRGVAVDRAGNVYITDSENDRVLQYDTPVTSNDFDPDRIFGGADGTPLACFGNNTNNNPSQTTMSCPIDVAVDGVGNLYVSDIYNHRILAYRDPLNDNTPDVVFGQPDFTSSQANGFGGLSGTTTLNNPLGMTFDTAGNFYVADFNNHRLLVYNAPPASLFNANLIENGDAEASAGSSDGSTFAPASWRVTQGNFTAVQYGASGGFPASDDPGPINRGDNFFGGGLGSDATFAEQVIDVSTLSDKIDNGEITFEVSGYFGGFLDQTDTAALEINFKDENDSFISQERLGDFTPADRQNQTGLFPASAGGTVPAGTRSIQVFLQMQRLGGFNFNDGYADNLSLVLSGGEVQVFLPLVLK